MLRFVDGFDHLALADLTQKWSSVGGASNAMSSVTTRFGVGQSISLSSNGGTLTKNLDAQGTWIVGFALRLSSLPSTAVNWVQCNDGAGNQVSFQITATGTVAAYRNGTLLGTSTTTISTAAWHFIEFKAVISATVGVASCTLDGVSILNLTTQNTKAQTNATALIVIVGPATNSGTQTTNIDDLYIFDGTGSVNNDFAGDCRVQTLYPSAAGTTNAFAASGGGAGATNYTMVNEAQGNGDTNYVSSSTVGAIDTYTYQDIPTANTVKGVQVNVVARKDDAGTRTVAPVLHIGSIDYAGTAQALTAGSYTDLAQVYEQNPATTAAWAASEINAAEFGAKIAS